jgi:hypothetical protein
MSRSEQIREQCRHAVVELAEDLVALFHPFPHGLSIPSTEHLDCSTVDSASQAPELRIEDSRFERADLPTDLVILRRRLSNSPLHRPDTGGCLLSEPLLSLLCHGPDKVIQGILERKDGLPLEGVATVLTLMLPEYLTRLALSPANELDLPQRNGTRQRAAEDHTEEAPRRCRHRFTPSRLSGSGSILDAPTPSGLQEGCIVAMTAQHTALRQRPEQGVWLSWRPESNRGLLFTRQLRCRLRHASGLGRGYRVREAGAGRGGGGPRTGRGRRRPRR